MEGVLPRSQGCNHSHHPTSNSTTGSKTRLVVNTHARSKTRLVFHSHPRYQVAAHCEFDWCTTKVRWSVWCLVWCPRNAHDIDGSSVPKSDVQWRDVGRKGKNTKEKRQGDAKDQLKPRKHGVLSWGWGEEKNK